MKSTSGAAAHRCSVVYLGLDDFPLGMAQTQNVRLFCRALLQEGCRVTVLSRWWGGDDRGRDLPPEGEYEGIRYVHACGHVSRPGGWLQRKFVRLRGHARELATLWRMRRAGELDIAILNTWSPARVVTYILLGKVLGFPTLMHLVEYYDAYTAGGTWKEKLNARVLDYASLRLVDGVLPISAFLIERVERLAPGLPWLKDPGLTDVTRFAGLMPAPASTYFLYCGYLGYSEVIHFCMQAFDRADTPSHVELRLVVHGTPAQFAKLEMERRTLKKADRVSVQTGLTDRELSQRYLDAYALLIPLRPTDQDRARFPHKIGEYCGAARPIISTKIGEIAYRFTDGVNAFVAEHYDVAEYAGAMEECLADPRKAAAVGAAGRMLAEEVHHFGAFAPHFRRFVLAVIARRQEERAPAVAAYPLDDDRPASLPANQEELAPDASVSSPSQADSGESPRRP